MELLYFRSVVQVVSNRQFLTTTSGRKRNSLYVQRLDQNNVTQKHQIIMKQNVLSN
jgi:hypothetical protein